jgi:hypothetical protein
MPPPQALLRTFAEDQDGLFTTAEAHKKGVSRHRLATMKAAGEIEDVHRGVYRFCGVALTRHGALRAALLAAGDDAVLAYATAAELHGLQAVPKSDDIEICLPYGKTRVPAGVVVHHSRRLDRCDVIRTESGLWVTTGARTAIDLSRRLDRSVTLGLVDEIINERLSSRRWLHRRALRLEPGRPEVRLIREVTGPGAAAAFRSYLESTSDALFRAQELPRPEWNVPVYDSAGCIGIVDCYWAWAPLIVELEGMRFHSSPAQRRKDAERFSRLVLAGHRPLRFTYRDVIERPLYVVEQIRTGLAGRPGRPVTGSAA